jgi:small subunit ribosomal protein S19
MLKYLPSRARRSLTRMNDANYAEMNQKFLTRINKTEGTIRTHRRDLVVLPTFVGKTIAIHNGSGFIPIEIKPEMIGHYFGEFAMTRGSVTHSGPGVGATKSSKHVALK